MPTTPRISGTFIHFGRFLPCVSHCSSTMLPEVWRTAMAVTKGPRIITPSISAWPPIEVFFAEEFE